MTPVADPSRPFRSGAASSRLLSMWILRLLPARTIATGAAALGLLLLGVVPASADAVTTTTGQTLHLTVSGAGLDQPQLVAYGTARISAGPTTIRSVAIRIDQGAPIPVELDARGHFRKGAVLAFDLTTVEIEAIATASDGSKVNAIVVLSSDGNVTRPASPDKSKGVRTLAPTGATGPRTLGPIGVALVLAGLALVRRSKRAEEPRHPA